MKSIELRGMLTPEIKEKAEAYLHREFTQKELRLYAYLQYCCTNSQSVDRRRIDISEQRIVEKLEEEQHLIWTINAHILPTRQFYTFMSDIVADAYVQRVNE